MEIMVTRRTTAPPEVVWAVATDIEGSVDVLSGVTGIERLDDGEGFGPGLRWRETRELFGREASEELEVTAVDPGRSYTVEAHSGGTHYRSVVTVEPDDGGGGSRLAMTFGAEQQQRQGWLGRMAMKAGGKAVERATRKALAQDLDDLAAAAEDRAGTA